MIPNNLLTLIKQNDEKLEEVIKIFRNFTKDKLFNEINNKDYIKFRGLLLKCRKYNKNYEAELANQNREMKLLSIQEILELYYLEIERCQNITMMQFRRSEDQFQNLNLNNINYHFLNFLNKIQTKLQRKPKSSIEINERNLKFRNKFASKQLISIFLEFSQQSLQYQENKSNEIQSTFSEFNLFLKEIMILMYQIMGVPQINELKNIKKSSC
ncbi:unnamed protein product [Paramecium octaurelia]|uniref:Uncharacterized protein n=1 Tax=Paramecium octaurelia TaxID=43137 RepID=A0A8S1TYU6_PAROT|nr:unnamed protein product [Paramecium octaurelia]